MLRNCNQWNLMVIWVLCALSLVDIPTLEAQTTAPEIRSNTVAPSRAFCEVFDPCVPFSYPDSLVSKLERSNQMFMYTIRPSVRALLSVMFDHNGRVTSVEVAGIQPVGVVERDAISSAILGYLNEYAQRSILGSMVRRQALSFVGGRPESGWASDGFMDVDTTTFGRLQTLSQMLQGVFVLYVETGYDSRGHAAPWRVATVALRVRQ